jgi:hypothetical protein
MSSLKPMDLAFLVLENSSRQMLSLLYSVFDRIYSLN